MKKCIRKNCRKSNRQHEVEVYGDFGITECYVTEDGKLIADFEDLDALQRWNDNVRTYKKSHNWRNRLYYMDGRAYWDTDIQLIANDAKFDDDNLWETNEFTKCAECGEIFDKDYATYVSDAGGDICEDCLSSEFSFCEKCEEYHYNNDMVEVHTSNWNDNTIWMCEDCAANYAFQCPDCGAWYEDDCGYTAPDGSNYCEGCYGDHFTYCADCGEAVWNDDVVWIDDEPYCEYCAERRGGAGHVRSYHNNPSLHKHYADGEERHERLIGTEVETDSDDDNVSERADITWERGDEEDTIYQMRDGSLSEYGIECITQPMSKAYWDEFDFEGWMKELVDAGARAHDTTTCGLHVHLSRTWLETDDEDEQAVLVGRMRQFLSDNIENVQRFSRRTEERWCKFTKSFDKDNKPETREERIAKHKEKGDKYNGDRYQSINNTNRNTIEFRIFKGTLKPNTYRASVEFCLRVVDYVLHAEENTETWKDFMTYKELPQSMRTYMTERHMQTEF